MSAAKIFIDPNEDVVFTREKIERASSKKVILVIPESANIISTQVSLKLLSRILIKSDKLVVVVTEDELGQRYANNAGLISVHKISNVNKTIWEKANSIKQEIMIQKDKKKLELINQRNESTDRGYELIDEKKQELEIKDSQNQQELEIKDSQNQKDNIPIKPIEKEETIEPFFKKLEPKIVNLDTFILLAGGDITQHEKGKEVKKALYTMVESRNLVKKKPLIEQNQNNSLNKDDSKKLTQKREQEQKIIESQKDQSKSFISRENQYIQKKSQRNKEFSSSQFQDASKQAKSSQYQEKMDSRSSHTKDSQPYVKNVSKTLTNVNFANPNLRQSIRNRKSQKGNYFNNRQISNGINGIVDPVKNYWTKFIYTAKKYWYSAGTNRKKVALISSVIFLIVILASMFIFPFASVKLNVVKKDIAINETINAQEGLNQVDLATMTVPLSPIIHEDSRQETATATGTKEDGDKASSSVNILNQNNKPITLKSGTKLTLIGKDNLIYKLQNETTVPAVDSAKNVPIIAEKFGEAYNQKTNAKKDFALRGVDIGGLSVFTYNEITGGTNEEFTVVTQSDIDTLKNDLIQILKNSIKTDINELKSEKEIEISSEISFSEPEVEVSAKANDKKDNFTITVKLKGKLYVVKEEDLIIAAQELAKKNSNIKGEANIKELKDPQISNVSIQNNKASFTINSKASVIASIDKNQIKGNVMGLSTSEAEEKLANIEDIENAKLDYYPFFLPSFLRFMPQDESKIEVELN